MQQGSRRHRDGSAGDAKLRRHRQALCRFFDGRIPGSPNWSDKA